MKKRVVLIGAGKHAMVIAEKLMQMPDFEVYGFLDNNKIKLPRFIERANYKILGEDTQLSKLDKNIYVHLCLGANLMDARRELIAKISSLKLTAVSVIHTSAYIAPSAQVGDGTAILSGAIINTNARIGTYCCINTGAIVEHDCILGDNVFIQPRSVLAGNVSVGSDSIIGIGAIVRENIKIGRNCLIGGGAFVSKNIPDNSIAYGVPAKIIGKRGTEGYKTLKNSKVKRRHRI